MEPPKDFEEKVWGIEDATGHRYQAQISDGPNGQRWLLPLPRHDFEKMWAAMAQAHPEWVEQFGSPQNFLRQYIGQLMSWMLTQNDLDDPEIDHLKVMHEIQQWENRKQAIETLVERSKDKDLPVKLRKSALEALVKVPEDELRLVDRWMTHEHIAEELANL